MKCIDFWYLCTQLTICDVNTFDSGIYSRLNLGIHWTVEVTILLAQECVRSRRSPIVHEINIEQNEININIFKSYFSIENQILTNR